jgi:hypothetical protein
MRWGNTLSSLVESYQHGEVRQMGLRQSTPARISGLSCIPVVPRPGSEGQNSHELTFRAAKDIQIVGVALAAGIDPASSFSGHLELQMVPVRHAAEELPRLRQGVPAALRCGGDDLADWPLAVDLLD